MNKTTGKIITIILLTLSNYSFSEVIKPVKWKSSIDNYGNNTFKLTFEATIDDGWHLYGTNIPENGPIPTSFNFDDSSIVDFVGRIQTNVAPDKKYDNTFEMELELYDGKVKFYQEVQLKDKSTPITGYITYMACDDSRCLPPSDEEFHLSLVETKVSKEVAKRQETPVPAFTTRKIEGIDISEKQESQETGSTNDINNLDVDTEESGKKDAELPLWKLILRAILGGFGAIITPCVYPMIPLTISFFMRDNQSKGQRIFQGVFYGTSIVLIYTAVGFISGVLKVDLSRLLSSHWIPNLIFFLIFVVLAFSFFGMFELVLPSKLSNKLDQKAEKGGLLGPFFMALTTAVVSFSCTGPIAGIILGSAMKGNIATPTIGMFFFALAFALPFTFLAIFPGTVKSLPKSGGWLNSVKVVFAFIMLALSLLFLSNMGLSFINRSVILAIAIIIFTLQGFYLLGKIKFSHDSDVAYISVPRLLLVIISFSIAVYLIPGMFGSPLKSISQFLPPQESLELDLSNTQIKSNHSDDGPTVKLCDVNPKYSEQLHLPHNLKGYFDYEQGMTCAKEQNKPVFVDFVGHYCKNCKKMYSTVWSDPQVQKILREEYIIIALYTDDNTKLPENKWVKSELSGRILKTMGKINLDFQTSKFGMNSSPMYAILNTEGEIITSQKTYTYNKNIDRFLDYLEEGVDNFKKLNKLTQ